MGLIDALVSYLISTLIEALLPYIPAVADTINWTNLISNQLPFALMLIIIGLAGAKKQWYFGHQVEVMRADKDAEISRREAEIKEIKRERDERIEQVRKDTEVEIARLKEERERERTRSERYENLTFRSLETNQDIAKLVAAALEKQGKI